MAEPREGWGDRIARWWRTLGGLLPDETIDEYYMRVQGIMQKRHEEEWKDESADKWASMIQEISSGDVDVASVSEFMTWCKENPGGINSAALITYQAFSLALFASGVLAPASQLGTYQADRRLHTARLDPASGYTAARLQTIDKAEVDDQLRDQGWDARSRTALWSLTRRLLDTEEALALWHRGELGGEALEVRFSQMGYDSADIANLKKRSNLIPGIGDLVRMAVREAWRDDIAAKWGYDEDYVAEFGTWMEKQGMSEAWARKYWRAHWELPSLTMAREMVHRTDFTVADFKDLLRTADIPRGYRDYLAEIIFTPFTRVDIRRMYRTGTLKEADLVRAYMDIGYNREKALLLTDFTIREYGETEREATKADILSAFTDDLITRVTARNHLLTLEYPDWLIGWYLDRAELAKTKRLVTETVRYVKVQYINYHINRNGVYSELGKINFPATRIDRLLTEWDITRLAKVARPSISKLEGYFLNDTISQSQFVAQMGHHKYAPGYINWAVKDILRRKKEEADKDEERVRKEQERLEVSELRTDRDLALSKISVTIAQARAAIADIQIALLAELDPAAITTIEVAITKAQDRIATINLQIARHRAAITELQLEPLEAIAPERVAELREVIATERREIAEMDVAIAELFSNIADIMVLLVGELTDEQRETYLTAILVYQAQIADIEVGIAIKAKAIAETQLSLVAELTPERVTEVEAAIAVYRDRIADSQVEVAQQRTKITELRISLVEELSGVEAVELRTGIAEYRALIETLNLEKARIRKGYYREIAEA